MFCVVLAWKRVHAGSRLARPPTRLSPASDVRVWWSVRQVYEMMMKRHGYPADAAAIDARYKVAYKRHKTNDELRYVGDGKEFWRVVVMEAVDCQDPKVFEDIYNFYELPAAWKVGQPEGGSWRPECAACRLALTPLPFSPPPHHVPTVGVARSLPGHPKAAQARHQDSGAQ